MYYVNSFSVVESGQRLPIIGFNPFRYYIVVRVFILQFRHPVRRGVVEH